MKTLFASIKMMMLAAGIISAPGVFAQTTEDAPQDKKYIVYVIKSASGEEIAQTAPIAGGHGQSGSVIRLGKIDGPEAPPSPLVTADNIETAGKVTEPEHLEAKATKKITKSNKVTSENKEKKITIIEKEEGGDGKIKLEISSEDLTTEERMMIIQNILDANIPGKKVQMIKVGKDGGENVGPKDASKNQPSPLNIDGVPVENLSEVRLFPNPSSGEVHLTFKVEKPTDIKLRITDLQGNEVYASVLNSFSGNFDKEINRSDLAKGTYLLDVIAGTEKTTTKVVMQ